MSRIDETIEYLQILTDDIKEKALKKSLNLSNSDSEKISIIVNKTVSLFDEATDKVKQAANVLTNEEELNAFLKAVEQKCLQNKILAAEKFEEVLSEIATIKQEVKEEVKVEEKQEVNPYNDTAQDVVDKLVEITKEHPIVEEVIKATEEPKNEETIDKAVVEDNHYKMSELINSIKSDNKAKEAIEVVEEKAVELVDNIKVQEEKVKTSINSLLENDNVKYAAEFILSKKNNIVEFMEKPETKQVISDLEMSALKAADRGLDFLIKVLDSNKEEN